MLYIVKACVCIFSLRVNVEPSKRARTDSAKCILLSPLLALWCCVGETNVETSVERKSDSRHEFTRSIRPSRMDWDRAIEAWSTIETRAIPIGWNRVGGCSNDLNASLNGIVPCPMRVAIFSINSRRGKRGIVDVGFGGEGSRRDGWGYFCSMERSIVEGKERRKVFSRNCLMLRWVNKWSDI